MWHCLAKCSSSYRTSGQSICESGVHVSSQDAARPATARQAYIAPRKHSIGKATSSLCRSESAGNRGYKSGGLNCMVLQHQHQHQLLTRHRRTDSLLIAAMKLSLALATLLPLLTSAHTIAQRVRCVALPFSHHRPTCQLTHTASTAQITARQSVSEQRLPTTRCRCVFLASAETRSAGLEQPALECR
jgi:hypothetical protein